MINSRATATAITAETSLLLPEKSHFSIKVTQRSEGQASVAGVAYESGEKLFSEYDQKTKNYSNKEGILYTEIMLPDNAPPEYSNWETP